MFPELILRLPDWVREVFPGPDHVFSTVEEKMRWVIRLARWNVEHGTGGPFGAAVFERDGGKLLAPGVNCVVPANCSIAHAEMVAIALAQQMLEHYDLGGAGMPACELVASAEPCAMCLGAIPWSGVRGLVCGARDEDVVVVGFDEGTKPPNWPQSLETRGINVVRDVLRQEACQVLTRYAERSGPVYNARRGNRPT